MRTVYWLVAVIGSKLLCVSHEAVYTSSLWIFLCGLFIRAFHTPSTRETHQIFSKRPHMLIPIRHLALLLFILDFRNELHRAAEYSEAREAVFGSVIHKLMAETISTLTTLDLISAPSLLVFGHTVFMDGLCEGWPGGWMLIFGSAGEQLVSTFGTYIHAGIKMIFIKLPSRERTERHDYSDCDEVQTSDCN